MCGIYCSNLAPLQESHLLSLRGPDHLSRIKIDDFFMSHSLLSITGEVTPQPLIKNNIVCLFNGEIYNHEEFGDYDSDGESIIDCYLRYGWDFTKYLDGEFCLILYDPNKQTLIISSDTFRTKPIYYSLEGLKFGCSSYKIPLILAEHSNIKKLPANTTKIINLKDGSFLDLEITKFNLEQKIDSFERWDKAFEESIAKRTRNCREKLFIGLSSGHDSGAICNELIKQNREFKAYSVTGDHWSAGSGPEDEHLISLRVKKFKENMHHQYLPKTDKAFEESNNYIKENTEVYKYNNHSDLTGWNENILLTDDSGSNWYSWVCKHAKEDGYKVCLSGSGADEIISDYGFNGQSYFPHSCFGGKFPDNLEDIFPWKTFFEASMESYLMKEEYVGGAHGIETRYTFLDKKLVKEFLNLEKDLKNSQYKSVIHQYLEKNWMPFMPNFKRGF